jgi:hypothetical protein
VRNTFYLSTSKAATKLSIAVSTLKKLRIRGGGPAFHRIGRRIVYASDVLDEWATRETFETTSQYASQAQNPQRGLAAPRRRVEPKIGQRETFPGS